MPWTTRAGRRGGVAGRGYRDIVQLLLKYGASVNSTDRRGQRALDVAREKGKAEIIALLGATGTV